MQFKRILIILLSFVSLSAAYAQEGALIPDTETFEKARVISVLYQGTTTVAGTDTVSPIQTLKVLVLSGPDKGKVVTFKNDYIQLSEGETLYVRHTTNSLHELDSWAVSDPYRLHILLGLSLFFVVLIFVFGGIQGVRGLASLIGSFFLIFYLLIPGIYQGHNAVLVSIAVASLIIVLGSYLTHGFNRTTTSAVISMIATVILTGLGAYYVVHAANLSGYSSEESTFLNLNTRGAIDMVGLLFGGIMIGLLGVLYDIAIGQAIAVEELYGAGQHLTRKEVYRRALRIGREHIGALVNTLAIAYVGASLPLLLLMQSSTTGLLFIVNNEIFSTEIVRILIGSIGLVLGVPITTFISCYMLYGKETRSKREHRHH